VHQRQLLVGIEGVIDEPMEQSRRNVSGAIALHQGSLSTRGSRLPEKRMAIEALPHQGHEQMTRSEQAAVGADRSHGCIKWRIR